MSNSNANQPSASAEQAGRSSTQRQAWLGFVAKYGSIMGMIIMIALFSIAAPKAFPTLNNFLNVLNQASLTAIIAGGLTVAIIVGELDLSIGFNASLAGVLVTGLMVKQGLPVPVAIMLVLVVGVVIGIVNGYIVTKLGVNSVIATLGTGSILVGLTFAYSTGVPIASGVPKSFTAIALNRVGGVPNNVIIMFVVLFILWILVNRTDLGQQIQAVGGNIEAARLSGIRVDRVKIIAFAVAGMYASLTGILLASLIGSGTASAGDSYLLNAFAAAFLGSATLKDGEFHIPGTFIGVMIIGIGFNGLAIFGAPTFYQYFFQGVILILAVGLSTVARRLADR
ncbi:MAG: ABC transporter permease [Caldilineaceae bacterium]|nr:ABC transporter permease [Caldilineaceae bacterium]MBP8106530.1 ABC transporter permease [Caldilineaceae bacterium]MBP8121552.1 ABC transporter permease [Caldilineaceae bacterium]MBP9071413.1 ABC transporter permease [Caldilineaceae bacterium]